MNQGSPISRDSGEADAHAMLARDAERAEHLGDWPAAAAHWRSVLAFSPGHRDIYLRTIAACREAGEFDQAETLSREARALFPGDADVAVMWATLPERRGDAEETARRCAQALARFPDQVRLYVAGGTALRDLKRLDEADSLLTLARTRFPDEPAPLVQWCTLLERRGLWDDAVLHCQRGRARFPGEPVFWVLGAMALRETNRIAEALPLAAEAAGHFPDDPGLMFERARLAVAAGRWEEAAALWRRAADLVPGSAAGPLGEAEALQRLGRVRDADAVLEAAVARMPDDEMLAERCCQSALVTLDDPALAETRLRAAQERFPESRSIARQLYEARSRLAAMGGAPAPAPETAHDEDRQLVLNFESLGGGGHGCEFGIFQRSLGAEPLGLLRWADIHPAEITTALANDLEGVGEPEFTRVFVPDHPGEKPEYWSADTRYHMAMRSFVLVENETLETMSRGLIRRQRFLRRKLLEDLRSGTKIFVYKNLARNLSAQELTALLAAVRRHGDNTLFYIAYADDAHPNGTVEVAGPGLLVGYIDHFSNDPVTDAFLGFAHDQLLTLCRRALALWRQGLTQRLPDAA